eukprot:Opistho-2@25312
MVKSGANRLGSHLKRTDVSNVLDDDTAGGSALLHDSAKGHIVVVELDVDALARTRHRKQRERQAHALRVYLLRERGETRVRIESKLHVARCLGLQRVLEGQRHSDAVAAEGEQCLLGSDRKGHRDDALVHKLDRPSGRVSHAQRTKCNDLVRCVYWLQLELGARALDFHGKARQAVHLKVDCLVIVHRIPRDKDNRDFTRLARRQNNRRCLHFQVRLARKEAVYAHFPRVPIDDLQRLLQGWHTGFVDKTRAKVVTRERKAKIGDTSIALNDNRVRRAVSNLEHSLHVGRARAPVWMERHFADDAVSLQHCSAVWRYGNGHGSWPSVSVGVKLPRKVKVVLARITNGELSYTALVDLNLAKIERILGRCNEFGKASVGQFRENGLVDGVSLALDVPMYSALI